MPFLQAGSLLCGKAVGLFFISFLILHILILS